MILKWKYDKNNFLLTESDIKTFNKLPLQIKTAIYTQFMFKGFLFKFRRFFDIKK